MTSVKVMIAASSRARKKAEVPRYGAPFYTKGMRTPPDPCGQSAKMHD